LREVDGRVEASTSETMGEVHHLDCMDPPSRVTGQFFETVVATTTPVTVSSSRGRRVYQSVSDDVNNVIECLHCLGVGLFGTKDGAPLSRSVSQ